MKISSNLQNVVCTVKKLFLDRKSISVVIVLYLIKLIQKCYTYRFKKEKYDIYKYKINFKPMPFSKAQSLICEKKFNRDTRSKTISIDGIVSVLKNKKLSSKLGASFKSKKMH